MKSIEQVTEEKIPSTVREIYEKIYTTYPFFDDKEKLQFYEKVKEIKSKEPLDQVKEIVEALNNPHVDIKKTKPEKGYLNEKPPSVEMIDSVMVLHISSFSIDPKPLMDQIENNQQQSIGIIIDLCDCSGGNENTGRELVNKLIKKGKYITGDNYKFDESHNLKPVEIFYRSENENPYDKPVVILTSDVTCSSAERFIAAMKSANRCTLIGTNTDGGSGNPDSFDVEINGEKYTLRIPVWRFVLKGQTRPLEETKIKPDIYYDKPDIVDYAVKYVTEYKK